MKKPLTLRGITTADAVRMFGRGVPMVVQPISSDAEIPPGWLPVVMAVPSPKHKSPATKRRDLRRRLAFRARKETERQQQQRSQETVEQTASALGSECAVTEFAWTIRHKDIDWPCRTEQDALGVLVYLRDFGRAPMGAVSIEPAPTSTMAALLATLPNQQGTLL
jgi:hypothetical protein